MPLSGCLAYTLLSLVEHALVVTPAPAVYQSLVVYAELLVVPPQLLLQRAANASQSAFDELYA